MKKISLFFLIIAATFTSCSSDDDSSGSSEASLIGKWQWTAAVDDGVAETLDECDLQDVLEFKMDGSIVETFFNSTSANGQITCSEPQTDSWEWALAGDQLTFIYPGEMDTATVTVLNDTTLTIKYEDEETPGTITIYTETYTRL